MTIIASPIGVVTRLSQTPEQQICLVMEGYRQRHNIKPLGFNPTISHQAQEGNFYFWIRYAPGIGGIHHCVPGQITHLGL